MAPVPAAPEEGGFGFFLMVLLNQAVKGTRADRANQGVANTLRISRSGRSALVMAYAVANLSPVSESLLQCLPRSARGSRCNPMRSRRMHTRRQLARLLRHGPTTYTSKSRHLPTILSS